MFRSKCSEANIILSVDKIISIMTSITVVVLIKLASFGDSPPHRKSLWEWTDGRWEEE